MGKLQAFEICFSKKHGVYYAGKQLQGCVSVVLEAPLKIRNIQIWIYGRAKVHWSKSSGSDTSKQTTHYRAEEIYLDKTIVIHGSMHHGSLELSSGRHTYKFEVDIPASAPSSFESSHGWVRYLCKAKIHRPWKFDHEVKAAFSVVKVLDLNHIRPQLAVAQERTQTKDVVCCCCACGTISCTLRANKKGYVPGENILMSAEIKNGTKTTVEYCTVALKQHVIFHGRSDAFFSSGEMVSKTENEMVAKTTCGEIKAGKTFNWENISLKVPPLPPSKLVGCNIIKTSYVVEFSVSAWDDLKISMDIVIGTKPLHWASFHRRSTVTKEHSPSLASKSSPQKLPLLTYEECVKGQRHIREDHDSDYTRGQLHWAPSYPVYTWPPEGSNDNS